MLILQASARLHVDVRAPGDTMTVLSPPPGITPVESVIRWFFSVPQWVELAGAGLAIVVALIALVLLWRNAGAMKSWVLRRHMTTPLFWKAVIGAVAVALLVGMAGGGTAFFVYSQNDNQFCLSCHTLHDEVYERFQQSKHHRIAGLRCHDCHDEPLVAEVTQVAKWMVRRPSEVGPHAPVPRQVCAGCHVQKNADHKWQRIIATAGHSVHLQSDTARKLGVECLTCHGVTAHRFVPVAATCAQSGCHSAKPIQLGKMAGQTSLHCVTCHQFTAPVAESATTTGALARLVPVEQQCLGCHEMRQVIKRFVPENDPHKGECGACHNPHTQTKPAEAFRSCMNSGCHTRPDTLTSFHRGIHAAVLKSCGTCHQEHTWKVKGTTCLTCHENIFKTPPTTPFSPPRRTSQGVILKSVATKDPYAAEAELPQPILVLAAGNDVAGPLIAAAMARVAAGEPPVAPPPQAKPEATTRGVMDSATFSHATHRALTCASCHSTTGPTHGTVMIRSIRDCQRCHHEATVRSLGGSREACLHCHAESTLPARSQSVTVVTTTAAQPMTRSLPFTHTTHGRINCAECHTAPVTLARERTCASCHSDHHGESRDCKTCHAAYDAHRGVQTHTGCGGSGCHSDAAVLALEPRRNVCLACHSDKVDHKPERDCATCHRVHWTATPR